MIQIKHSSLGCNGLKSSASGSFYRIHLFLDTLGDIRQKVFATLRLWWWRTHERDKLGALSDWMLSDIGLTRGEADYLSRKPFWKE